jgi:hypothetical protein
MSAAEDAWRAGRGAWERLAGWLRDDASPGHADTGDAAVDALEDIGVVRRLLDQAELVAVRTARRHGKSWAEIATRLGVSRQSAWERWRDIDDETETTGTGHSTPVRDSGTARIEFESHAELERGLEEQLVSDVLERRARGLRRRSNVVVPNVVGTTWDAARDVLRRKDLFGVSADDDPVGWSQAVVNDQSPESGAKVAIGSRVLLWVERGDGGAGVREPRRPKPTPGHGREWKPEPSEEAVG